MIGAKGFVATGSGLRFRFSAKAKNGASVIVIRLMPDDTYELETWSRRGVNVKQVGPTAGDLHADDLVRFIEAGTGLRLSMGSMGRGRRDNPHALPAHG